MPVIPPPRGGLPLRCCLFPLTCQSIHLFSLSLSLFFLAAPWHMELLGWGGQIGATDATCCHSCGNAGSLTHCAGPGIKPASQCSRGAAEMLQRSHCAAARTPNLRSFLKLSKNRKNFTCPKAYLRKNLSHDLT